MPLPKKKLPSLEEIDFDDEISIDEIDEEENLVDLEDYNEELDNFVSEYDDVYSLNDTEPTKDYFSEKLQEEDYTSSYEKELEDISDEDFEVDYEEKPKESFIDIVKLCSAKDRPSSGWLKQLLHKSQP